jgi:hypothetical protein
MGANETDPRRAGVSGRARCVAGPGENPSARTKENVPMSKIIHGTRKTFGIAAVAAAMVFGAAAALASPATAAERAACSTGQCRKDCIAQGNSGGVCVDGFCACFIE